ncbi:ABC transporter permease [Larkinella terrae]|uniref:FtsX-like permease family protein n=1 Tax=Larkinella terrae TaxID=2025311 RepID=A0A7K0ER06_9BACT|nr:ABC transporter permease [Larkinella terrae]MRS64250.1 FtsX-like permease family protein [Larkinella terrae]
MLTNYLKIAWRNLKRNKTFSLINILGLALGMACSLIILLWVQDELAMDRFHANDSRIYRVMENQAWAGQDVGSTSSTPGILAENLKKDFQEVEKAAMMTWEQNILLTVGNTFGKEKGRFASGDFLSIFSFPLKQGDARTALARPDAIVISEKLARKYFPHQDALGKVIRVDNTDDMMVTGVMGEIPENSSLKFDYLMSWERFVKYNNWVKEWGNNGPRTFVLLSKNADSEKVSAKIKDYIKQKTNKQTNNIELFLQKSSDAYLHSNFKNGKLNGGRIEYVQLFIIVAVFILIIACINFMNLATARSVKRAKEVGVRKVVGAERSSLMGQFVGESMLISLLALLVAVLVVVMTLPVFNELTEKHLAFRFDDPFFWLVLLGLTLVTGLVSGSYPALFLSSLKPVVVLKGVLKFKPSATFFRKGLVVFQFSLSIILIVGMIIIYRQIQYIQTKNLGFDKENLLYMPLEGDLKKNYQTFRRELLTQPGIKEVSASWSDPLEVGSSTIGVGWRGKDTTQRILFNQTAVHYGYLKAMDIKLKEGRDFSPDFSTDTTNYIINEESARKIGYKNPIGQELTFWGRKGIIVGVVKNYHINSLHVAIEPLILHMQRKEFDGVVLVRAEKGRTREAMANLERTFHKFNPRYPFEYKFTDQEFGNNYKSENIVSKLANYFAFLAIFISCLGLFGLAAFTAEQRTKEIGIRKVLGASITNIVLMLSKDFLLLVLLSSLVALPVAWWAMSSWLEKYKNRIDIEWWMFAAAVVASLAIALFTISFQSIKAALMNPVKSLKTE